MTAKPTYEELEQRVKELEKAEFERKRAMGVQTESKPLFQKNLDIDFLSNGDADAVTLDLSNIILEFTKQIRLIAD